MDQNRKEQFENTATEATKKSAASATADVPKAASGEVTGEKISFFQRLASPQWSRRRSIVYLIFAICSCLPVFLQMFMPLCHLEVQDGICTIGISGYFDSVDHKNPAISSFALLQLGLMLILLLVLAFIIVKTIRMLFHFSDEEKMAQRAKGAVIVGIVTIALFALFLMLFAPINMLFGGKTRIAFNPLPLILMGVIALLFFLFVGVVGMGKEEREEKSYLEEKALLRRQNQNRTLRLRRLELLIYTALSSILAVVAILAPIITVKFKSDIVSLPDYTISGWNSLAKMSELTTEGERTISFFLFALLFVAVVLLFLSIVSFLSRSSFYGKVAIGTLVTSSAFCLMVALFSQYYGIVQKLNTETIINLINQNTFLDAEKFAEMIEYQISGYSLYFFLGELLLLAFAFIRRPYTVIADIERAIAAEDAALLPQNVNVTGSSFGGESAGASPESRVATLVVEQMTAPEGESANADALPEVAEKPSRAFDPCPALTELDRKISSFDAALEAKRGALFENPTLPALVDYIVRYARNSRHHLFYTNETIAAFLAGLGTTRLTILQGMSGTGKTSLPKIVAEALMSVCDIVEVESSWRDKNELLGYYNEFNRTYTPKKFTLMLYKAALSPETLTFIVLDEMNLSRIEYYFSDFLSLMENEEGHREIKLLNVSLARTDEEGSVIPYRALTDGHTLKVPNNVWFIGTANRDESTYDISDKVYDRAHTMNFDRRASKVQGYGEPIDARYLPAETLLRLFREARESVKIDLDKFPVIAEVEALLEPYGISFGNRVAMQMESFVSIYAACFQMADGAIDDALETILLSKVVRKLELKTIEDKEALAAKFAKLHLPKCSRFISEIKED